MSEHDESTDPRKRVEPSLDGAPKTHDPVDPDGNDHLEEGQALLDALHLEDDGEEFSPALIEDGGLDLLDDTRVEPTDETELSVFGEHDPEGLSPPAGLEEIDEVLSDSGETPDTPPTLTAPPNTLGDDSDPIESLASLEEGHEAGVGQPPAVDKAAREPAVSQDFEPQAPADRDDQVGGRERPTGPGHGPAHDSYAGVGHSGEPEPPERDDPSLPATLLAALGAGAGSPAKGWQRFIPGGRAKKRVRAAIPISAPTEPRPKQPAAEAAVGWLKSLFFKSGGLIAIGCFVVTIAGMYVLWAKESARPGKEVVTAANQALSQAQIEIGELSLTPNMAPLSESWARSTLLIEGCGLTVIAMDASEPLDGELSTSAIGWPGQAIGGAKQALACLWVAAQLVPMNVFDINLNGDIATIRYKVYGTHN